MQLKRALISIAYFKIFIGILTLIWSLESPTRKNRGLNVQLPFQDLRWEVIVRFVHIGGIVDNHCLNFHFIIYHKLIKM